MAEHQAITAETGMPIYLCKPRSPWQRGWLRSLLATAFVDEF
jgi:IS30 family transposase